MFRSIFSFLGNFIGFFLTQIVPPRALPMGMGADARRLPRVRRYLVLVANRIYLLRLIHFKISASHSALYLANDFPEESDATEETERNGHNAHAMAEHSMENSKKLT